MVQIISDENQSIAGSLGRSFGRGLGEQLPKGIERGMLSKGLQQLGQNKELTPFEKAARLYSLPGGAEAAQQLLPLLHTQTSREALTDRYKNSKVAPKQKPLNQPSEEIDIHKPSEESGFVSPRAIQEVKSTFSQKPGTEEIERLAAEKYAPIYPTLNSEELKNLAEKELNQNYAQNLELRDKIRTEISQNIGTQLQNQGLNDYQDVPGEIQKNIVDQIEHMVFKQGMTPEEASHKMGEVVKDLGKARNLLKEAGSRYFWEAPEKITDLKSLRSDFKKFGFEEIFDNLASGELGISRLEVAHELDPIKNKKIDDVFKNKNAKVQDIIKYISPKDNIYDIEYRLRETGGDINGFRKKLQEAVDNKDISLTDQQRNQLKAPVTQSFLGDLLFRMFK